MKSIFLFDMDGTLTPPRQKMPIDIEIMLKTIQESGSEVGIITGSDMNYIKQHVRSSVIKNTGCTFLSLQWNKIYSKSRTQVQLQYERSVGINYLESICGSLISITELFDNR